MLFRFMASLALALLAAAFPAGPAAAAELFAVSYLNAAAWEIIQIDTELRTAAGPRIHQNRVCLAPGRDFRLSVSDGTAQVGEPASGPDLVPEKITFDLAEARWIFEDLSGLTLRPVMNLTVFYDQDGPRLEQKESDGAAGRAVGREIRYLTRENRASAVDKDTLIQARTYEDFRRMAAEAAAAGRETGAVRAGLEGTLFEESEGRMLIVPMVWSGRLGVGRALPWNRDSVEIFPALRLGADEAALGEILDEFHTAGLRPWVSRLQLERLEDAESRLEETFYTALRRGATEDRREWRDRLTAAWVQGSLHDSMTVLVGEAAFSAASAALLSGAFPRDSGPVPGVFLFVSRGVIEAFFIPDCAPML